jgi:hypothetical protein
MSSFLSTVVKHLCEASDVEKPGAGIPHAGICEGQSGNWLFYLDGTEIEIIEPGL